MSLGKVMAFGFSAFVPLQFIRPGIPEKPSEAPLDAPSAVRHVLERIALVEQASPVKKNQLIALWLLNNPLQAAAFPSFHSDATSYARTLVRSGAL